MEVVPHLQAPLNSPDLPSYIPRIRKTIWNEIVPDKMYYYLTADEKTWDRYKAATGLPYYYHVNILDVVNARKYSSFILQLKCTTRYEFDSCCMISDEEGALCLVRGEDLDHLDTYRFTYT